MSRATDALDAAFGAVNEVTKHLPTKENVAVQMVLAGHLIMTFAGMKVDEDPEIVRLCADLERWLARAELVASTKANQPPGAA